MIISIVYWLGWKKNISKKNRLIHFIDTNRINTWNQGRTDLLWHRFFHEKSESLFQNTVRIYLDQSNWCASLPSFLYLFSLHRRLVIQFFFVILVHILYKTGKYFHIASFRSNCFKFLFFVFCFVAFLRIRMKRWIYNMMKSK